MSRRAPWVGGPTAEIRELICAAIETVYMPMSHAAAGAGVDPRTARRWLEQGQKDVEKGELGTDHALFALSVAQARSAKTRDLLTKIMVMAQTPSEITGQCDPKPLMWMLERTEPEFRLKTEQEVTAHVTTEDPRDRIARLLGETPSAPATGEVDPVPQP